LEYGNHGPGAARLGAQARSPLDGQEPGDVCGRGGQRADHGAADRQHRHHRPGFGFNLQITLWLWFTVLFANFAEAMAEGRGKAQADTLRKAKGETIAKRYTADGGFEEIASGLLRAGDVIYVEANHYIAGDGEVIEGVASVDESAITGESAPVIREAGGDRSAVTGGTKVLSDWIKVRITSNPGETFLDRMIALVEGATRQKTPNEIALSILLSGLTIVFLLAVVTLQPFAMYSKAPQTVFVLVSLLVCLIPTTIGGLLSAIGIAGMDRLVQYNVLAMSGRAVEAAGDVNTLLLDKTGTITLGNRQATEFLTAPGRKPERLANAAQLASLSDETPEGRSIVVLAKEKYNLRGRDLGGIHAEFVPFTAQTRMSGVNLPGTRIRKGSVTPSRAFLRSRDRNCRRRSANMWKRLPAPAARRWSSPKTPPHWASFTSRTSSRAASRSASPPARHGHPHHHDHRRQSRSPPPSSPARPASTTSWPKPSPKTRWT
jgi:K+-transporting ATPase ATPase B chain